jgi:hypothetical protein
VLLKEILVSLGKDKDSLLDFLRQLHSLSGAQRGFVEGASAEAIEKYTREKGEKLNALNRISDEMQRKIKQIQAEGDISDKEAADKFIFHVKNEYQSIVQDIIDIESKDKVTIAKMKDAIGLQINEIEKVRGKLKNLKGSYASNGESALFDKEA